MGEARRRAARTTVYHHTSILRTNLLWMSGAILPEGQGEPALHPVLEQPLPAGGMRRAYQDFPPLVWFTTRIRIPGVLLRADLTGRRPDGTVFDLHAAIGPDREKTINAMVLNRVALGFPTEAVEVRPWPAHPGYTTPEGEDLNETAVMVGDDPRDWYVAEQPVDLMSMSETWISRTIMQPKLERSPGYLAAAKAMVAKCRAHDGKVYIPPTWMHFAEREHAR